MPSLVSAAAKPRCWRLPAAPIIPAEALRRVAEPLAAVLRRGESASAAAVAQHLASLVQPTEADITTPEWLRPEQHALCRRLVHVISTHNGALLAEPVGSGKTYVALAVAHLLNRQQITSVLAPAPLLSHWKRVARTLAIAIDLRSHTAASRGQVPEGSGMVIVDESHHYRTPGTRRYATVARWLLGRPALLLTATPAINRLSEVAAQLLLAIRDDALAPWGTASLKAALQGTTAPSALGELIVARPYPERANDRTVLPPPDDGEELAGQIDRLVLATDPQVAGLIRRVLLAAAASSPAALAEAAGRYERLLLHARDAAAAGRPMSREGLRRFVSAADDQLMFWELLPVCGEAPLDLSDLDSVRELRRRAQDMAARDDSRSVMLRQLLADGTPTLVFCTRRATVRWLRDRLGDPRLAWCTGERAGIGPLPYSRTAVLEHFRSTTEAPSLPNWTPTHLIATDIAAEGLDLRRLTRVVHYDEPWTAARLAQREGRTIRDSTAVTALVLAPAAALEARLGRAAIIRRKAALPRALGLGVDSQWWWTWRELLSTSLAALPATAGCAVVQSDEPGLLAGLVITAPGRDGSLLRANAIVLVNNSGTWDDPRVTLAALTRWSNRLSREPTRTEWQSASEQLGRVARERLGLCQRALLAHAASDPILSGLMARLHRLIREAARERNQTRLRELEIALRFVGRGHTSGEGLLLRSLADVDDARLLTNLTTESVAPAVALPQVRVSGVLIALPKI